MIKLPMKNLLLVLTAIALLNSCTNKDPENKTSEKQETKNLKIDGSSTVYLISEAVAEDYKSVNSDLQITIGTSGTGGGFKKFVNGEIDICDASRPIKPTEVEACKKNGIQFHELPIAYDGLAVVVNSKNTWVDKLTVSELKTLWGSAAQGKIMNWSQVRKGFPDKEIKLFGPGTDSGTFDYFCEAVNGGKENHRGDYTSSENDNQLVQGVASDEGSIGYFGLAYYEANKDQLKLVPIDDGNNENGAGAIIPTMETVQNGIYAPLSRALFIYVNDAAYKKPEVKGFLDYYIKNVPALAEEVGYIPLPGNLYTMVSQRMQNGAMGTLYTDGEEAGTKLHYRL
jgi:phosphate transport system substrate-binding protein